MSVRAQRCASIEAAPIVPEIGRDLLREDSPVEVRCGVVVWGVCTVPVYVVCRATGPRMLLVASVATQERPDAAVIDRCGGDTLR